MTKRALAALIIFLFAVSGLAVPLSQWSQTAGSNNASVPDGAPENWTGSQVNDWGRQTMAVIRAWYQDPQWLELTYDLAARGAKTLTKVDDDTVDIDLVDATAYFTAGRRIKIVGATTVTCYVVSSTTNAGDTRIEVGTSCVVPVAPTAIYGYIGQDLRSGAFATVGPGGALDADTVDGAHAASLSAGLLDARITYASASTVTIGRGYQQKVRAEIDGVVAESSSDLTVDITTADREDTAACGGSAAEQNSTWYTLYLDEASGVPVEHISFTPPVMDPASGKVGYHPGTCSGSTGWRAVGAVYNDASGNFLAFDRHADGWWMIRAVPFSNTASTSATTNYTSQALTNQVPAIARQVRLEIEIDSGGSGTVYYLAPETLSGVASATNRGPFSARMSNLEEFHVADVPVDATPTVMWAHNSGKTLHTIRVIGWRDDLGIVH